MATMKILAEQIVGSVTKRAVWKAGQRLGERRRTSFDETDVNIWVESPDIGRKGSVVAGEISLESAHSAVGTKFPGNGKDAAFRVGGEIVIIPKDAKHNSDICEIDGENFTYAQRSKIITKAVTAAAAKGVKMLMEEPKKSSAYVVPFDWTYFMEEVNKYSHPQNPGEWDSYVAQIYGWIRGGNRAAMKKGKWTAAPLRPDESIPDDEKCEVVMAALTALDEAHEVSATLRRNAKKRSAAFWNETKRAEGSLWAKEERPTVPASSDTVVETVVAVRPPTLLRSTSRVRVCEEWDAAEAAAVEREEDQRRRDERDLVDIMG